MVDEYLKLQTNKLMSKVDAYIPEIAPTNITISGLIVGTIACGLALFGFYIGALVLWLLNRLLDGLDGHVARLQNKQTDLGGYLDMICDIIIYACLPLAIAVSQPSLTNYLSLAFLIATFYINLCSWMYLSALLAKQSSNLSMNTSIPMPKGIIEGTETIIFYSLFLIFPNEMSYLFIIMGILVIVTAGQRVDWSSKYL